MRPFLLSSLTLPSFRAARKVVGQFRLLLKADEPLFVDSVCYYTILSV